MDSFIQVKTGADHFLPKEFRTFESLGQKPVLDFRSHDSLHQPAIPCRMPREAALKITGQYWNWAAKFFANIQKQQSQE